MAVFQTNKDEKFFSIARPELLMMIRNLSDEKFITEEEVFDAVETALLKAAYQRYGYERNIKVKINRKTGAIEIWCVYDVVSNDIEKELAKELEESDEETEVALFDENKQIKEKEAKKQFNDAVIGDQLETLLPPIEFGRAAFQSVKQIVNQRIKTYVKAHEYEEYKDKVGEIINGMVKRIEYGNVFIDINNGKAEGYLMRVELIPTETLHTGERVRAYIFNVKEDSHGPQIYLSRTHPEFLAKLFEQEVPEIYEGVVEIKSVARDPGSKAKVAVYSEDQTMDPVGACVGMRGVRVQGIVNELQGEKIDVVQWSDDMAEFIINAISPADVSKVVLDEDIKKAEVVVAEDQLSVAIGRKAQNVRLASMLTGWSIDILSEDEEAKRREEEVKIKSKLFIKALDIDEVIARLLISEGFSNIEEVAYVPVEEISQIEGFDADLAKELQERAKAYDEETKQKLNSNIDKLGIEKSLSEFKLITPDILIKLGENKIKTLDDLGDLATDELIEIIGEDNITQKDAEKIIMKAREHWFDDAADADNKKDDDAAGDSTDDTKSEESTEDNTKA